jgi:excisionase family DNA binding protein
VKLEIELTDELVEQIAALVAERIGERKEPGYMDVKQAAAFLACKPDRIYDLVSARRIPHERDGGRLLFDRDELRKYVRNGGAKRP